MFGTTSSEYSIAVVIAMPQTKPRSAYKTAHSSTTDALLAERNRIDSSHRMTDDLLEQAYETRAEFGRQRGSILGVNTRMGNVLCKYTHPAN